MTADQSTTNHPILTVAASKAVYESSEYQPSGRRLYIWRVYVFMEQWSASARLCGRAVWGQEETSCLVDESWRLQRPTWNYTCLAVLDLSSPCESAYRSRRRLQACGASVISDGSFAWTGFNSLIPRLHDRANIEQAWWNPPWLKCRSKLSPLLLITCYIRLPITTRPPS